MCLFWSTVPISICQWPGLTVECNGEIGIGQSAIFGSKLSHQSKQESICNISESSKKIQQKPAKTQP